MTCPRAHCGGLLVDDDGEWVCKSCARRWADEALKLERALRAIKDSPETDYGVYAKYCEETAREGLQDRG